MHRFYKRLMRADARISRLFSEECPAILSIGSERRPVMVIFESPDAPVRVPGGGEINDQAPAFSALTEDIKGLSTNCTVELNHEFYRVTHIGADEMGRTRVTLGRGRGTSLPAIEWSKK